MNKRYASWAARWRVPLGFGLGIAYLVFAQPTFINLAVGGTIALGGLTLRAFAAGYLDKNAGLAAAGPYAYTRNPLYLGSFLMGLGLALAGTSWLLGTAFTGFFLLVYYPVMRREEDSLRGRFGKAYELYASAVPLFFPIGSTRPIVPTRPTGSIGPTGREALAPTDKFLWTRYRRNREYEAALGFIAGMVFLALKLRLR